MSVPFDRSLAGAIIESVRTASTKDRATFWQLFGSRTFPALAEPLAEAVRLAAAVELVASRMDSGLAFFDENPGLADAGLARLTALEVRQGLFDRAPRLTRAAPGRETDQERNFARLLAAFALRDFNGVNDIIGVIDRNTLSHPMTDILTAYYHFQAHRGVEGRHRLVDGVQKLRRESLGVANADFWRAFALAGARDHEFSALLVEAFAGSSFDLDTAASVVLGMAELSSQTSPAGAGSLGSVRASVATLLRRPDARDCLSVQKWTRGVDLIAACVELEHKAAVRSAHKGEAAEATHEPESDAASLDAERRRAQARVQQARLQFAVGHEQRGLAGIRAAYQLLNEKRDIRIVQLARPIDIPSIPSVRKFKVGGSQAVAPSPISRVDAGQLRPTFDLSVQWAADIDGASVLTGDRTGSVFWYVTTRDGWMLADGLNVHPRLHFGSDRERMSSLSPSARVLIDGPVTGGAPVRLPGRNVLLGGVPNYYHWLMEYLPKIGVIKRLMPDLLGSSAFWLINDNMAPWQVECLSGLGVEPTQIRTVKAGVGVRCDSLIVPSMMSALDATTFLREALVQERDLVVDRRIYVSRLDADAPRRRIYQEELLVAAFHQAGFEILVPSEMSFQDQVDAFAGAAVIVGPHGAGMTNLAFAHKDSVVVEIVNTHNQRYRFFSDIAEAVGFKYARFLSGSERANDAEPENANSIVDPQKLLSFIDRLRGG